MLAASEANKLELPANYHVFAKLVEEKVLSQGIKLKPCGFDKVPGTPEALVSNAYMHGKLFKKSQVIGKW